MPKILPPSKDKEDGKKPSSVSKVALVDDRHPAAGRDDIEGQLGGRKSKETLEKDDIKVLIDVYNRNKRKEENTSFGLKQESVEAIIYFIFFAIVFVLFLFFIISQFVRNK